MKTILSNLRGAAVLSCYFVNTLFWAPLIYLLAIIKLILPFSPVRKVLDILLNECANNWIWVNNTTMGIFCNIHWYVEGTDELDPKGWYLVVSNHQSWVDIMVLQRIFHKKIPFLKFFLKKELFWFPIMGQAWWALDYPFMKRYTKEYLEKHPEDRGKDLEITKKACEKFKTIPVSVMNFVEGTRFTEKKHSRQNSPFTHLLRPKAGGIGFVLGAMGENLKNFLDVTIVYPNKKPSFWDYLCGKVTDIRVQVRSLEITKEMVGDYFDDAVFRNSFQAWVNSLWEQKDAIITEMKEAELPLPRTETTEPLFIPKPFPVFDLLPEPGMAANPSDSL